MHTWPFKSRWLDCALLAQWKLDAQSKETRLRFDSFYPSLALFTAFTVTYNGLIKMPVLSVPCFLPERLPWDSILAKDAHQKKDNLLVTPVWPSFGDEHSQHGRRGPRARHSQIIDFFGHRPFTPKKGGSPQMKVVHGSLRFPSAVFLQVRAHAALYKITRQAKSFLPPALRHRKNHC